MIKNYSLSGFAKLNGVAINTVREWIRTGKIKYSNPANRIYVIPEQPYPKKREPWHNKRQERNNFY
jgi:predicted site-specific integrase-resolvase